MPRFEEVAFLSHAISIKRTIVPGLAICASLSLISSAVHVIYSLETTLIPSTTALTQHTLQTRDSFKTSPAIQAYRK